MSATPLENKNAEDIHLKDKLVKLLQAINISALYAQPGTWKVFEEMGQRLCKFSLVLILTHSTNIYDLVDD